jgi:hypothetical protein
MIQGYALHVIIAFYFTLTSKQSHLIISTTTTATSLSSSFSAADIIDSE